MKKIGFLWKEPAALWTALVVAGVFFVVSWGLVDRELLRGNFGIGFFWATVLLKIVLAALTGLFVGAHVVKRKFFGRVATEGKSFWGLFLSFVGFVLGGCAACSVGILSVLGLGAFLVSLPWAGLELLLAVTVLMGWLTRRIRAKIDSCARKK